VHDDTAEVQARIVSKAFRGNEFLYTLELRTGELVMAHVPSHHDHRIGEWIGIRPEVDARRHLCQRKPTGVMATRIAG